MRFQDLITESEGMQYGAGVCIFCPRTGRFLLQKRGPRVDDPGEHDWFGGGVDEGEDILEGAIRELEEEGGIKAQPESLYPLARFGYQPEKGLGGYHIWLLVVDDEFDAVPNWDGDTHDEVEGFDWIGAKEWGGIKPHERVWVLFSDPGFKDSLKHATEDRVRTGHVAKLQQNQNYDAMVEHFIYSRPTIDFMMLREHNLVEFNMQQMAAAVQQKMARARDLVLRAPEQAQDAINSIYIRTANAAHSHPVAGRIKQAVQQNPRLALFGSAILSMLASGAFEGIAPGDVAGTIDHLMQTGNLDETGMEIYQELIHSQNDPRQGALRQARTGAAAAGAAA